MFIMNVPLTNLEHIGHDLIKGKQTHEFHQIYRRC